MTETLKQALEKIAAHDLDTILAGLEEIRADLSSYSREDLINIADTVGSLFFIDAFDRPDLRPAMEAAIDLLAGIGPDIIPYIMDTFEDSDVKANISHAIVLGKIGVPAIPHLIEFYLHSDDPYKQAYALYALGKIKDKSILAVLSDVIEAVDSEHQEIRDSAIRALGKTMELIGPKDLSTERRDDIFNRLIHGISDHHSVIRAKCVRSLGKMCRSELLTNEQLDQLERACRRITGQDENYRWDRAYIVRKEAEEVLGWLTG